MKALVALLAVSLTAGAADARPQPRARTAPAKQARLAKAGKPAKAAALAKPSTHDGAHARVAVNHAGDLRPAREVVGRRDEPLTAEEDTARQIEKLLRGPLRAGVTGLFVADARTGEALFAVNADEALNPASNVKMISTAAALELLGPDYRYPTRLLGPEPDRGVVKGDVYLLGSYDPTLTTADLDDLAAAVAARGITRIDGGLVVGADPTRDGVYRAVIPIELRSGEPGTLATATVPSGMDFVTVHVTAKTARGGRSRLTYKVDTADDITGHPHVTLTIGGTIAPRTDTMYPLATRERTATAAYALRAALRAHGVLVAQDYKLGELDAFVAATGIPGELARHESPRLAEIVARVNKWSINWLADRVIVTAAALAKQQPPSMELAVATMYDWLDRHPRIAKDDLFVDTGSGLSYRTKITAHELVSIVRSAAGFGDPARGADAAAHAWLASLSVAGTDGTLSHRFRNLRGHIRGKTGTLATSIALSGVLDVDPARPLAFALVTNGQTPLSKGFVRRAHEQLVGLLCGYLARTQKAPLAAPVAPAAVAPPPPEDLEAEPAADAEPGDPSEP